MSEKEELSVIDEEDESSEKDVDERKPIDALTESEWCKTKLGNTEYGYNM